MAFLVGAALTAAGAALLVPAIKQKPKPSHIP